jgi:protein-L-isoaspartate(D-aspartate) O-methyltransferase
VTDWKALAARLADQLIALDKLRSPRWQAAIRAVPRHALVPMHYTLDPRTHQWVPHATADDLAQVSAYTALFVLPGGRSSTSMPGLMTRMLESLDVRDGHDVLEIGTGAGYNAALLSHRLGDQHVFSVDVEAELIELARTRLADAGYHPTLVAADGAAGLPDHAPYDRIIATCSVPAVPCSWVEQTRSGGLILVDVKPGRLAGNLVLLRRNARGAEGHFDPVYGSFMPLRTPGAPSPAAKPAPQDRTAARSRITSLDLPRPWEHTAFWFFAHFALPPGTSFSLRADSDELPPSNTVLTTPDGSWCEVDAANRQVWEAGPHPLWRIIEDRHALWRDLGEPGWERFGLTALHDHQWAWLDAPDGEHTLDLLRPALRS